MQTFHPNQCQLSNMSKYIYVGGNSICQFCDLIHLIEIYRWMDYIETESECKPKIKSLLFALFECTVYLHWTLQMIRYCQLKMQSQLEWYVCNLMWVYIVERARAWLRWIMISRSNWFTMVFSLHCICNIVWFSNENYVTYQELQSALMSIHSISFGSIN